MGPRMLDLPDAAWVSVPGPAPPALPAIKRRGHLVGDQVKGRVSVDGLGRRAIPGAALADDSWDIPIVRVRIPSFGGPPRHGGPVTRSHGGGPCGSAYAPKLVPPVLQPRWAICSYYTTTSPFAARRAGRRLGDGGCEGLFRFIHGRFRCIRGRFASAAPIELPQPRSDEEGGA